MRHCKVSSRRKIALSFDDGPTGASPLMSGPIRTQEIIGQLEAASKIGAIFFVRSDSIAAANGRERLLSYLDAGHSLANHGFHHLSLSETPFDSYLEDLDRAATELDSVGRHVPFFRHPYLDEGGSIEVQSRMQEALDARGLRNGHVSVCTYDFFLQELLDEHLSNKGEVDYVRLGHLYVDLIMRCVRFYDRMARKLLGRSPQHVLLLHENDLAAMFVGQLIAKLETQGWTIVSALEAYEDPIYSVPALTCFRNQGQIAALAHVSGHLKRTLVPLAEEEGFITSRFLSECVLK